MTVKTITEEQKQAIVTIYQARTRSIKQIAEFIGTSTRTVGRVLEEKGIASPVARLKGDAHRVMKLLYQHKISVDQLEELLEGDAQGLNLLPSMLQSYATKKSPAGHNGRQVLLPMDHIPVGAA